MQNLKKARLVLQDGTVYEGTSFGYEKSVSGEVVFYTAMTGYPESLTDPSYKGQILVPTYPMIGNYGVPVDDEENGVSKFFESDKIHCTAIIISDYSFAYSHWNSQKSLGQWLKEQQVPGLFGIDTRALTKKLREHGAMLGRIEFDNISIPFYDPNEHNIVAEVSTKEVVEYGHGKYKVILVDCGVKYNIIRCLLKRDVTIKRVPWDYDFTQEECDGYFLSNGPGDPAKCDITIKHIKKILTGDRPIMGICLGNQLMARAAGAVTYKLKYGHRSHNQPVMQPGSNRCYITSQNHGFAIDDKTLEVTTTTRVSFFDELMSFPCFYPINEKFCEKQGDKYGKSADSILANGAFVMTNWEPGSVAEFEKNDKYYDAKTVKIEKLVMKLVQDPKVAAQAFEAGETDFAPINSDLVDKYKKDDSFKQINEGYLFYISVNFQNSDLANLNVRKALSLAINRKDLCENVLKDGSQAASGFVPSGLSISPEGKDFRDEADTYTSYDKKAAQAALDEGLKELGKSEITLRLTYGTDESPMDVFATYLQNAFSGLKGLKIEMVATTKQDRIYNKQKNGDFDLSVTRWGPDYGDPTTYLTLALTNNNNNYGHWSNTEFDSIMEKVNNETDANARWQLMIDAEKIMMDDLCYIPVFEKGTATLQNTKVKNLVIKPVGVPYTFEYVSK